MSASGPVNPTSSPINLNSSNKPAASSKMMDQQVQSVYDKLDKAQYYLDKAADIVSDLSTDRDVRAVVRAHPSTKLEERLEVAEKKINDLSDETMAIMLKELQQAGAEEDAVAFSAPKNVQKRGTLSLREYVDDYNQRMAAVPVITTPGRQLPVLAENYMNRRPSPTPSPYSRGNAIPTLKEDLSAADKMMVKWRAEGRSWAEIKDEYERLNGGQRVGRSTLPNRYVRLKASLGELDDIM